MRAIGKGEKRRITRAVEIPWRKPMVYRYIYIRINSSGSSRRGAFDSGATKAGEDNGKTAIDFSPPRRGVG